ncbi:hypothetical protein SAY87_024957 [Trapa incisa]|uniref:Aldehyde oxidase GLOX-like n=1 Tax=Trapa incisa TaxID=236973 RepID=A0AAN7JFF4_9MYRT|nr:hypothetical protein SAY87_024957 [Trapa incisa]
MAPFYVKNQSKMGSCSSSSTFTTTTAMMILLLLFCSLIDPASSVDLSLCPTTQNSGKWEMLLSIGISAMHMQLIPTGQVVIFDRTDSGRSNLSLPDGQCRYDLTNKALQVDCTAHSALYDPVSNTARPLTVQTDTWCSSGSLRPDGTLIQTGGFGDGERKVRTFTPCGRFGSCDWVELNEGLHVRRWYSSNQILSDGRVIILGGRSTFTYEFFPKANADEKAVYLNFLRETRDPMEENNLYPFLHLLPDGNLFVFANRRSILFDYNKNKILKEFPEIPGTDKRNYPSTGSSVLLPLRLNGIQSGAAAVAAEVMICGGSPAGAYNMSHRQRIFVAASTSCGRIRLTDPSPEWTMEEMPVRRVMGDMILLPNGEVLIVNGALNGTAGWEDAIDAIKNPVLYRPDEADPKKRFDVLRPTETPRMYHSTAILLPDGRILVGGSNPHVRYNFKAYPYPTELSLEAFYPPYLGQQHALFRPSILSVEAAEQSVSYGQQFSINFVLKVYWPQCHGGISVALIAPSFTTHSFGMNQRLLFLEVGKVEHLSLLAYKVTVAAPPTATVAPPGFYMLSVVHSGIPSQSLWVRVH